jgi:hypothetical protein
MCKLFYFVQSLAYSCSIIILTVISLERYVAIRHPMFSRRFNRTCFVRGAVVGGVWVVSAAYSLPLFITYDTILVPSSKPPELPTVGSSGSNVDETISMSAAEAASPPSGGEEFCVSRSLNNAHRVYVVVNFVLLYVAPLLLMTCVYARISVVLWRSGSSQSASSSACGSAPKLLGCSAGKNGCRSKSIAAAMLTTTAAAAMTGSAIAHGRAGSLPAELLISVLPAAADHRSGKRSVNSTPKIGDRPRTPTGVEMAKAAVPASAAATTRLRLTGDAASTRAASLARSELEITHLRSAIVNGRHDKLLMIPSPYLPAAEPENRQSTENEPGLHPKPVAAEASGEANELRPDTVVIRVGSNGGNAGSAGSSFPSSPVTDGNAIAVPQSAFGGSRTSLTPMSGASRCRSGSSCANNTSGESAASGHSPLIARRKVVRLLVAIVSSFAICMLPHHVRLQWQEWSADDHYSVEHMYVPPVTTLIFYVNSCLNPLLYALISDRFRKAFAETRVISWFCRCFTTASAGARGGLTRDGSRRRRANMPPVPVIRNEMVSASCTA